MKRQEHEVIGARGRKMSPPLLAAANCQHAVSGICVRSKIVPAVTELRRCRPSTATGHHPVASHRSDRSPGRRSRPASAATISSPGSPRRWRTRSGTRRWPLDRAGRPPGARPQPEPTKLLRLAKGCKACLLAKGCEAYLSGSSRFLVNGPAEKGVHAAVRAALASRIRAR